MTTDMIALICAIVASAVGATWVIGSKLASIETALSVHIEENKQEHRALDARVIKLEGRKTRR